MPHRDLKACTIYNVLTEETDLFFARLQNMARRQYMTLGTGIDLISAISILISINVFSKRILTYEPRCEKTGFLHMRKQRRRSDQRLKPCTHGSDLHIRKFCIYANFAYVSKSIFCFAFTWLFKISRICQKLKFNSIKMIHISSNS